MAGAGSAHSPPTTQRVLARRKWAATWLSIGAPLFVAVVVCLGAPSYSPTSGAVGGSSHLSPALSMFNAASNVTFSVKPNSTFRGTPYSFWGVNGDAFEALNNSTGRTLHSTSLNFVLWPGGRANDMYDPITNTINEGNGVVRTAPTSEAAFVRWCRTFDCHAIQGLPGEIDNPTLAGQIVSYIERTLGFHPSYWEIGNEPALWESFGIPWTNWTSTQSSNVTPDQYAQMVHSYISAIRAVDPTARILGLPGVGTGAWHETDWIQATVALNGPNLSGVGIHVYPAGHTTAQNGSLSQFYGSLTSSSSLAVRVPADLLAISSACPTCYKLRLFVTEIGSGSVGPTNTGNYGAYMAGFPQVPYIATEAIQGLNQKGVSNLDFYDLEGAYPGALLTNNGTARPLDTLFSELLNQLGPVILPSTATWAAGGFYAVATANRSSGVETLLFTNVNAMDEVHLDLVGSGIGRSGTCMSWAWSNKTMEPTSTTWTRYVPANWTLPAVSVLLLVIHPGSTTSGPSVPPGGTFLTTGSPGDVSVGARITITNNWMLISGRPNRWF
ncbi:MAG: glycoside hydrolase family 44 protein [Thermoplasmata archaeon]|nr:glycoside hydrolase family 44 protein [Thermoplasmata archaeon]